MSGPPRRSRLIPLLAAGAVVVLAVLVAVTGWRSGRDIGEHARGGYPPDASTGIVIEAVGPRPNTSVVVHLPSVPPVRLVVPPPSGVPVRVTVEGRNLTFDGLRTWTQAAADPADERILLVIGDPKTGYAPCDPVEIAYVIAESHTTVTIALAAYVDPDRPTAACPTGTRPNVLTVTLAHPLGDRHVVDVSQR